MKSPCAKAQGDFCLFFLQSDWAASFEKIRQISLFQIKFRKFFRWPCHFINPFCPGYIGYIEINLKGETIMCKNSLFGGGDSCIWIILIIIVLCCCCGGNDCGCNDCGC